MRVRIAALVTAAAGTVLYVACLRPRMMVWGATPAEAAQPMPGDELIADPCVVTTRAVTIDAPPEQVWPWLVQIGQGRGGLYSYDALENLIGLEIHSADCIVPELQALAVGDDISLAPDNAMPLRVVVLRPNEALVIRTWDIPADAPVAAGDFFAGKIAGSWAWTLTPLEGGRTRLIARWRASWRTAPPVTIVQHLALDPAQYIMERKMLLGIKERAERRQKTST